MENEDGGLRVHREHHEMLPIWFFVGVILLLYGLIILFVGIREYHHPAPVVLARYHASLWGGILLTVLGAGYVIQFFPRKSRRNRGKDPEHDKP